MQQKDTFLSVLDRLSPNEIPKLRLVCQNWKRWIDKAPWSWEAQEPFENAKRWYIKLGKPMKGERYSLLHQLDKNPWPGQCTMLCVRECDQVIEVKSIDAAGQSTLKKELTGIPGIVTAIRQLQHHRFAVGYDNGQVLIWNTAELDTVALNISAYETSVLQMRNVCVKKKKMDRTGIISTHEDDLLLVSDTLGHLKCFDLRDSSLRWEIEPNFPVMDVRGLDDDKMTFVCYDNSHDKFFVGELSCQTGREVTQQREIERRIPNRKRILKHAIIYSNQDIVDFELLRDNNDFIGQTVGTCTYKLNPTNKKITQYGGTFFDKWKESKDIAWLESKAYLLEDSFAFVSVGKNSDGSAFIAYPRRLPITQVSLLEDENVSNTLKK